MFLFLCPIWPIADSDKRSSIGGQPTDSAILSGIDQSQPIHWANQDKAQHRAIDLVPAIKAAEVVAGLRVADVPAIVIAAGPLEVWLILFDRFEECINGPPIVFGHHFHKREYGLAGQQG